MRPDEPHTDQPRQEQALAQSQEQAQSQAQAQEQAQVQAQSLSQSQDQEQSPDIFLWPPAPLQPIPPLLPSSTGKIDSPQRTGRTEDYRLRALPGLQGPGCAPGLSDVAEGQLCCQCGLPTLGLPTPSPGLCVMHHYPSQPQSRSQPQAQPQQSQQSQSPLDLLRSGQAPDLSRLTDAQLRQAMGSYGLCADGDRQCMTRILLDLWQRTDKLR
mmetsp:Transcript_4408/g.9690  ORF Transcript_4408/g.9690 Transcript_4408/m.9690 type:complete len:213 (+) Transcript_4408:234-872(+)